jgi:hypothetical protein
MSELAAAQDLRPQFRLRSGRDDLVIDWLASVQPRQRSDAIRNALRNYVYGQREPVSRDEDPDLAAALDALF